MSNRPTLDEFRESLQGKFTPSARKALIALAKGASVSDACKACGKTDQWYYGLTRKHPEFKELVALAKEISVDRFETILEVCAEKALTDRGYQKSLHFLLEARRRSVYGQHQVVENINSQKAPLVVELVSEGQEGHSEEQTHAEQDSSVAVEHSQSSPQTDLSPEPK